MAPDIRPASASDLEAICDLLHADALQRHALNPDLWRMASAPREKIRTAIATAMEAKAPSIRQQWLIAKQGTEIVGVIHSILLPVPPIYAGEFGQPGLIMEDSFVAPDAPADTHDALLEAAEADLIDAGAQILLSSSVDGGDWEHTFAKHVFEPLTLYFAKSGLAEPDTLRHVRKAAAPDVPAIVGLSAVNRQILQALHPMFWKPHADADARFGAWMQRSLTLSDRDMFVSETESALTGYAISQPATPLHFPTPHDISAVGVIDDFYHDALGDPMQIGADADTAIALFCEAEAARQRRGDISVLVVCPAAWQSKIELLERAGYAKAITWFIKRL